MACRTYVAVSMESECLEGQVVSIEETVVEEGLVDCGVFEADLVLRWSRSWRIEYWS